VKKPIHVSRKMNFCWVLLAFSLVLCLMIPAVRETLYFASRARVLRAIDSIQLAFTEKPNSPFIFTYDWLEFNEGLIAHAGGGIDGVSYTNSREAFESNYANGFRVFEFDFSLTSDGELVAVHDWESFGEMTGQSCQSPLSIEEFLASKIKGKYTPLSGEDVIELMRCYPDVYVMTDTEDINDSLCEALRQFIHLAENDTSILDRLIIQIYSRPMLFSVMQVYPFQSVLFTMYITPVHLRDIVRFCSTWGIEAIAVPVSSADDATIRMVLDSVSFLLVHPITNTADIQNFRKLGVSGFYVSSSVHD